MDKLITPVLTKIQTELRKAGSKHKALGEACEAASGLCTLALLLGGSAAACGTLHRGRQGTVLRCLPCVSASACLLVRSSGSRVHGTWSTVSARASERVAPMVHAFVDRRSSSRDLRLIHLLVAARRVNRQRCTSY